MGSKIESLPSDLEYFKIVYPRKYMKIMLEAGVYGCKPTPFPCWLPRVMIIIPIEAITALQAALRTKPRRSRTHAKALLKFHGIPGRLTL